MHRRRRTTPMSLVVTVLVAPLLAPLALGAPVAAAPVPGGPPAPFVEGAEPVVPDDDLGAWTVEDRGPDTWQVTWTAPRRLPVTSDRPTIISTEGSATGPAGAEVGVPTVDDDGRTVAATVVSSDAPDPADFDVVLSGQSLDEPVGPTAPTGPARWSEPVRELLQEDPSAPGGLPVVTTDYELDGIDVPGLPEQVEMVGHVVKPAPEAASPDHPLVLFLHGRHAWCHNPAKDQLTDDWPCRGAQEPVPSHLGYDYLQRRLAGQGYVTVSVAANGINAQDGSLPDAGAAARAELVRTHLDRWAEWAGSTHAVDLDQVVLVGHSRGGEGVARAALEIPLDAPYRVAGQVLLAPTDFSRQTTPYVPTATLLPYCDGDVMDLQGQAYTDVSRDLATDDTAPKSSVLVVGANHNFFNTEWTPGLASAPASDDWWSRKGACAKGAETRLTPREQRQVGTAYVAGAVRWFASGEDQFSPMYDGSAVRVGSTGDAVVLSHLLGGGRELRRPGLDAALTTPVGATTQLCQGSTPYDGGRRRCGRFAGSPEATPHWPSSTTRTPTYQAFEMQWDQAGGRGGLAFDAPLDVTDAASLDLRTVVDTRVGDAAVRVRVTDVHGESVDVAPVGGVVPALPRGPKFFPGKFWAQNLRVDPADLVGVDSAQLASVELVGRSDEGRIWVLDVAASPAQLSEVPAKRMPLVDLGSVRVVEGGPGQQVAELPYTVTGALIEPARFRVYGSDYLQTDRRTFDVELPAGSTDGSVGWEFTGDSAYQAARTVHTLTAQALSGVMVRDNHGRVVIVEDDPAPELELRAVKGTVAEGRRAVWKLTLSHPVGRTIGIGIAVRPGDGSAVPVRADDIGKRWLRDWTWFPPGTNPPLHKAEVWYYRELERDGTTVRFQVPIRQDTRREPRESVTVQARLFELGLRSEPVTIRVKGGR